MPNKVENLRTSKRRELLKLPVRDWQQITRYDSLIICPTGRKHDSGWTLIAIIGCRDYTPTEIAAYCDDIEWKGNGDTRTDMLFPAGLVHMWSRYVLFEVGLSLSSTTITKMEKLNA